MVNNGMLGGIAGTIKDKVTSDGTRSKISNAIVGTTEDALASNVAEWVSNSSYSCMFGNGDCDVVLDG